MFIFIILKTIVIIYMCVYIRTIKLLHLQIVLDPSAFDVKTMLSPKHKSVNVAFIHTYFIFILLTSLESFL